MNRNLCNSVIERGGTFVPLSIPASLTGGTGLMNPSVFAHNDQLLLNLRHVNYTLYHCEGEQLFYNRFGPLAYIHPENDATLRTINYLCTLNNDFSINSFNRVDTSALDIKPVWEFIGLEDARLVVWDEKLFMCGVRRDTKPNGEGRMELSEIDLSGGTAKEISRHRISPPIYKDSYCEKNWMPVIDLPYHFIKWTNPTELVKVNLDDNSSETVYQSNTTLNLNADLRGGSQVIPFKNYRICIVHEVSLFKNRLQQKDATYTHRFVVWDKNWNLIKVSNSFSFMTGEIEFCCGLTSFNNSLLITFGFQDNAAFLLSIPENVVEAIIYE